MKIAVMGSTCLKYKMVMHMHELKCHGHVARLPVFDDVDPTLPNVEYEIMRRNRALIRWADRIDFFWNQRTLATLLDIGMAFMANKPIKLVYLEPKTIANFLVQYEKKSSSRKSIRRK